LKVELTDRVMGAIADSLSAKTTFVIFCLIAFAPLLFQRPTDILGWDQYVSQTVIQLVALSVLAIVSKKESAAQQNLILDIHDWSQAQFAMMQEELALAKEERDELKQIMAEVHKNTKEGTTIVL